MTARLIVRPLGLRAFLLFYHIIVGIYALGLGLTDVAKFISHL